MGGEATPTASEEVATTVGREATTTEGGKDAPTGKKYSSKFRGSMSLASSLPTHS